MYGINNLRSVVTELLHLPEGDFRSICIRDHFQFVYGSPTNLPLSSDLILHLFRDKYNYENSHYSTHSPISVARFEMYKLDTQAQRRRAESGLHPALIRPYSGGSKIVSRTRSPLVLIQSSFPYSHPPQIILALPCEIYSLRPATHAGCNSLPLFHLGVLSYLSPLLSHFSLTPLFCIEIIALTTVLEPSKFPLILFHASPFLFLEFTHLLDFRASRGNTSNKLTHLYSQKKKLPQPTNAGTKWFRCI